jgi:predicted TIM-barrel fold metal-dependent hydrolase
MWGSDYPVCRARGKAISLADTFYWIYQRDLDQFSSKTPVNNWLIGIENLMAVRQMAILADLTPREIEALFYDNAKALFDR